MVAELAEATAWMTFQSCRGLALNTIDAYGRNLERYLCFLQRTEFDPGTLSRIKWLRISMICLPSLRHPIKSLDWLMRRSNST